MTLIHIWASPGPVDSGPYLDIIGTWILSYIPGPHLDLVTQVLIWASWDLVSQFHIGPHLELVILVPFWASS